MIKIVLFRGLYSLFIYLFVCFIATFILLPDPYWRLGYQRCVRDYLCL